MTETSIVQEQANIQRAEAKRLMLRHFGIGRVESNGEIERIVDCIIGAALLETMLVMMFAKEKDNVG